MRKVIKEIFKCYFCQIELKTNKNNWLRNRFRLKFWNNNFQDERLICYICLKYAWKRKLPVISEEKHKKQIFREYEKKGLFN